MLGRVKKEETFTRGNSKKIFTGKESK
jgi:hypothetical protein